MLKDRETKIEAAVAVRDNANGILPPCGRCRELMLQINPENSNAKIILSDKIMTLGELMPEHWINAIGEKVA
jgi:cytidine deaminase